MLTAEVVAAFRKAAQFVPAVEQALLATAGVGPVACRSIVVALVPLGMQDVRLPDRADERVAVAPIQAADDDEESSPSATVDCAVRPADQSECHHTATAE